RARRGELRAVRAAVPPRGGPHGRDGHVRGDPRADARGADRHRAGRSLRAAARARRERRTYPARGRQGRGGRRARGRRDRNRRGPFMNDAYVRNVIEAALLAAGTPLPLPELARLFDEHARPAAPAIRAALDALARDYQERGIELKETASGFRIQVRAELAGEISRLWPERAARYSRALLETLALIAYRQPITRAEIERNWVRVVGHRDVPGHPELLGTTREFLDYFGLKSLDELPPLAELKAVGDLNLQLALAGEVGVAEEGGAAEAVPAADAEPAEAEDDGGDDELSAEGRSSAE